MERYMQSRQLAYKTFEDNPYFAKNPFHGIERTEERIPTYEEIRDRLPKPIFDGHEDYIKCYDYAWETAFGNIASPSVNDLFVSNFIKTAFNGCLFMWDSSFIQMYAKYANRCFPFIKTLDNFYALQY